MDEAGWVQGEGVASSLQDPEATSYGNDMVTGHFVSRVRLQVPDEWQGMKGQPVWSRVEA